MVDNNMPKKEIDYAKLYEFLGVDIRTHHANSNEAVGLCPFHHDESASFAFDVVTGLWKCFAGCGHGNAINFICTKFKVVNEDAHDIYKALTEPIQDDWQRAHADLIENTKVLQLLKEKRGLTKQTIEKYKIGYNGERFTIPIVIGGVLVNIRKYSMEAKRAKMLGVEEFNTKKIFPYENLFNGDTIHLMEGEMDCLLANQLGINAVTVTAGAGNWKEEWGILLKEIGIKKVVICYDIDATGVKGAQKIRDRLLSFVKEIVVVKLPIIDPPNGDFTDYVHNQNHSVEEYLALVTNSKPEVQQNDIQSVTKVSDVAIPTTLHASSGREYYYKRIRIPVIVSGKNLTPYLIPRKVEFKCGKMSDMSSSQATKKCLYCSLGKGDNMKVMDIDEISQVALKLIDRNDMQVKGFLREAAKIYPECSHYRYTILDTQNVEQVRVIPDIAFSEQKEYSEYVSRQIFYLDLKNKRIKTNASYVVEGVVMPHPNTQASTILVSQAVPAQTDIDTFALTPQIIETLKLFQPAQGQSIQQKANETVEDLIYNVTKMYQREDMVIGYHMVAFSALEFYFMEDLVDKGWVEGLFIGDKGCGKSKTIERLLRHFRAGEIVSGENLSYAGLVGGVSSENGSFLIQWGKLPLNDRRMVCFEEAMEKEIIEKLSSTRSSGIASIDKIQSERTHARVRMLWSANPRTGRNLDTYANGVLAVQELMGKVEDTRRLDFALTVTETDVDLSHIEDEVAKKIPHVYTSEKYAKLVLWAWSRKKDHVEFTSAAVTSILKYSNVLSKRYSSAIPLVEPTEQRIKIARLAVATAAWMFSTDAAGEMIIVKPEHVDFVVEFLQFIFDKPSMGYNIYSSSQFKKSRLTDEKRVSLIKEFKGTFLHWDEIRDALLDNRTFRKSDLIDQTGMTKDESQEFFRWTARNKLVASSPTGFSQSPIFMEILKLIRDDENGSKLTNEKGDI